VKLLLDTHALLWWLSDDRRLGPRVRALIADPSNDVLISVVSLWEIVVKRRIGKLEADIGQIEQALGRDEFVRLSITPGHLAALALLPDHHRDPFDHLLIAQAIVEDAVFISDDLDMRKYPLKLQTCKDDR
jgi:PIN domain nuclease of toxin-antitoxin system